MNTITPSRILTTAVAAAVAATALAAPGAIAATATPGKAHVVRHAAPRQPHGRVVAGTSKNSQLGVTCALFAGNANYELDAAQQANADGRYGEIAGHLQKAAEFAAGAADAGCDVIF